MRLPSTYPSAYPSDLDPSTDQGRQWLADELAKSEYHDTRSIFERVMAWLLERLSDLQNTQGSGGTSLPPFVITLVVIVLALGVAYLLTRIRVESRTVSPKDRTLLGDSTMTPEQLRREAETAFAEQRYADAVVAWTRALARDAERRTLLPDAPSMTAHEVGTALASVFPSHADRIAQAVDLFDSVAYGDAPASRDNAELSRDLDHDLHGARPTLPSHHRRPGDGDERPPPAVGPVGSQDASGADSVWLTGVRP